MAEKIIEITGLSKRYKDLWAVRNLNLTVYKGDVFGFLGPNGAGKSTTIRMLVTLILPTEGNIRLFEKDLKTHRNEVLRNVGAIVEKPDFYGYLSAYRNLEILGKLSGIDPTKKLIMEMLELVGLESRAASKVKTFSHGMKQRLGIAQALLHNPELIILDEPTTGLDPQGMKEIRDLILLLSKERKKTILLSSHILHEVEFVANRMIIIDKGTTIVEGNVHELVNSAAGKVTFTIDKPDDAERILSESAFEHTILGKAENILTITIKPEFVPSVNRLFVEKGILVEAIVPSRSLEEYFLKLTDRGAA